MKSEQSLRYSLPLLILRRRWQSVPSIIIVPYGILQIMTLLTVYANIPTHIIILTVYQPRYVAVF